MILEMKTTATFLVTLLMSLASCGGAKGTAASTAPGAEAPEHVMVFDADSAYSYVKSQTDFGPRVPNTPAHSAAGDWLASELRRHGADVTEQRADLKAFDGTVLKARNIFGRFNPGKEDRLLLLAHWDSRPWGDKDPDPAKRTQPIDGANDGASGVGVILETARAIAARNPGIGIDILFADAEDWGSEEADDSWALGTDYFVKNPPVEGYRPSRAILLDMVGGKGAVFPREYFSQLNSPALADSFWAAAAAAGYADRFPNTVGGAVNDDHIKLIDAGIPAIDIIEFHPQSGFNPTWHTSADNISNIDRETLKAVGQTLLDYIYNQKK